MSAIGSFGAQSTTDEVLDGHDLTGRRVLVTGASAGLGVETIRALAAHGATVVGVARDLAKAESALAVAGVALGEEGGDGAVSLRQADLASLDSVRACADGLVADGTPFDLLIANAGVMACPQGATADGFETQFGTNHLGHFVLLNRLLPLVLASSSNHRRIVNLTSAGHRFGDVDLDDPNFERQPYDPWVAYGRSKTANILFSVDLDRRLRDRGIRAAAVHPGGIMTELSRHLTDETIAALQAARKGRTMEWKSIPAGAATTVWTGVVADADAIGGRYCEDCAVSPVIDDQVTMPGVLPYALDPDRAAALWAASEELVGESFAP